MRAAVTGLQVPLTPQAAADLARIHGPAGLDIGAANPAEIALSVAAQMVAAWRRRG